MLTPRPAPAAPVAAIGLLIVTPPALATVAAITLLAWRAGVEPRAPYLKAKSLRRAGPSNATGPGHRTSRERG